MRISVCFGLTLLFLSTSTSSVFAETPPKQSEIAAHLYDALINNESLWAFVDDEDLREIVCPNKEAFSSKFDPLCTVYLDKLPQNIPCDSGSSFIIRHFFIHETDCGADGNPDLMIEYEGDCSSHISNSVDFAINYLIYLDENKKYHIAKSIVHSNEHSFDIDENSFYTINSSCGPECHSSEMGFLDKQCQFKKLYTYQFDANDEKTPSIETEQGKLYLANITIQDKGYYRIVGNIDEKVADEMILSTRKSEHTLVQFPIEFKDTIITSTELNQQIKKAKKSKMPTKQLPSKGTNSPIEMRMCETCSDSYDFVPKGERCPLYNCAPRFDIFKGPMRVF